MALPGFKKLEKDFQMSSSEIAIRVTNLAKCYEIYDRPGDRLKQFIFPRLAALFGLKSKRYFREFAALNDISFEVQKGETVGVIGKNGSGKSTLLQIICGTLTPSRGSVEINGRVAALLELGSGFNPEFTGRENVYLNAAVLGLTQNEIEQKYQSIVEFADIGEFINQPIKSYSSGMLVRLAFAVIANVNADILIIDEALSVGDIFFTQKCMRFLRNFMRSGTILFVSHDTNSVRSLCTEALWLDAGEIAGKGGPKEISERYLEAFYGAQQEQNFVVQKNKNEIEKSSAPLQDFRQNFINNSNLRNDIQVLKLDAGSHSFGSGGAKIVEVSMLDENGSPLSWVVGGEMVCVQIVTEIYQSLVNPIIGFYVKDRLGQNLFGDNTYITCLDSPRSVISGQKLIAKFSFLMPMLPAGDYSLAAAIANGSQLEHIQHDWVHDAIVFRCESSMVSGGLVGIPMQKIILEISR